MGGSSFWFLNKNLGVIFSNVNHSLSSVQEWERIFIFYRQSQAVEEKALYFPVLVGAQKGRSNPLKI